MKNNMKKCATLIGIVMTVIILVMLSACTTTAVDERYNKDKQSEREGGLWRNLIIYNQDREIVEQYWGKFDIEITEGGNKIKFDMNGVRYIIVKGINDRVVSTEVGEVAVRKYWDDNDIEPHQYGSVKPNELKDGGK